MAKQNKIRIAVVGLGFGAEFVRSIVEDRQPAIDALTAAHWTAAGICAHESALAGGLEVLVPDFR